MYFILSLITTGILGCFMPQWMYDLTWQELNELRNPGTTSAKVQEFLKEIGATNKTVVDLANEKFTTICIIIGAIFIGMLIVTTIIKSALKNKKIKEII